MQNLHEKFVKLGKQRHKLTWQLLSILPQIYKNRIYKQYAGSIKEYARKFGGLSDHLVEKTLHLEPKLKNKPHLKAAIAKVGVHKVALVATLATSETDEQWTDKVENMSTRALQSLTKEIRKGEPQPVEITIKLDAQATKLFLKLKKEMANNESYLVALKTMLRKLNHQSKGNKSNQSQENSRITRHIPVNKKRELLTEHDNCCAYPQCNRPVEVFHHRIRFSAQKSHSSVVPLCDIHHQYTHNGLIKNELDAPKSWELDLDGPLQKADIAYREIKKIKTAPP